MRERIKLLETEIKELNQKSIEHTKSLHLRLRAERKCEQLATENLESKKRRTALQRKLKEETREKSLEKKKAKQQATKMLKDSQKLKVELNKIKQVAEKQAAVLRRKATEALHKQKMLADQQRKAKNASQASLNSS